MINPVRSGLALALFSLFAFSSAVAQTTPEKVLTPADVTAYIGNFTDIQNELDALGDRYDQMFADPMGEQGDLAESFQRLRELDPPAEVAAIMEKNGLGDRGFLKFVVISYCVGITTMENAYDLYASQYAGNAQMTAYLGAMKQNVDAMKSAVHPDDLALVSANQADLAPLLEMDATGY